MDLLDVPFYIRHRRVHSDVFVQLSSIYKEREMEHVGSRLFSLADALRDKEHISVCLRVLCPFLPSSNSSSELNLCDLQFTELLISFLLYRF